MQESGMGFNNPDESRRSSIRAGVEITAQIREHGYSYFKTRLLDISESGFRIAHPTKFVIGAVVYLKIPGLESLKAQVIVGAQLQVWLYVRNTIAYRRIRTYCPLY